MGGLFSSTNYERASYNSAPSYPTPSNRECSTVRRDPQPQDLARRLINVHYESGRITEDFSRLSISARGSTRRVQPPERSTVNPHLFGIGNKNPVVEYTLLTQYDAEYKRVTGMITNKRNFKVDAIFKITNPYLEAAYQLKKAQKQRQYGHVDERWLFHGTKSEFVDVIAQKNFNWRLVKTHKFGKGVSFSPKATYAANYSDPHVHNKVMFVVKVLISQSCIGSESMELPVEGCDTSQKGQDGIVIVKYEDNEFCPIYKILYHLVDENRINGNRNRRGKGGDRYQAFSEYMTEDEIYYY